MWQTHKVFIEMARHDGKPSDCLADVNVYGHADAESAAKAAWDFVAKGTKNADPVRVDSVRLVRRGKTAQ